MQAQTRRKLRPLSELPLSFPKPQGDTEVIKHFATVGDTLTLIKQVVREYHWQVRELAQYLKGKDRLTTCENIWKFCYGYIGYRKDETGKEQVRSPARTLADARKGVDCDCYAVLISSLLYNLNIPHKFRVTSYPHPDFPDPPYSHIYVLAKNGKQAVVLDPVIDAFNHQLPYLKKRDIPMQLEVLNGIPEADLVAEHQAYQARPNRYAGNPEADMLEYLDMVRELNGHHNYTGTAAPDIVEAIHALQGVDRAKASRSRGPAQPNPAARPSRDVKHIPAWQEALATGKIPPGTTLEQYKAIQRREFEREFYQIHGMSVEAYKAKMAAQRIADQRQYELQQRETMNRMRQELVKRGVTVPPGATQDDLIKLLRLNPLSKGAAQAVHKLNKFNPGAFALRAGSLLGARINFNGVGQVVWALIPKSVAMQRGMSGSDWERVSHAWKRWKEIHFKAGGDLEKLRETLIKGAYNKKYQIVLPENLDGVPLATVLGFHPREVDIMPQGLAAEPISTATALAAASTLLGALAALVKGIKAPNSEGEVIVDEVVVEPKKKEDGEEKTPAEKFAERFGNFADKVKDVGDLFADSEVEEVEEDEVEDFGMEEYEDNESLNRIEDNENGDQPDKKPEWKTALKWLGFVAVGLGVAYGGYRLWKRGQRSKDESSSPEATTSPNGKAGEPQQATKKAKKRTKVEPKTAIA